MTAAKGEQGNFFVTGTDDYNEILGGSDLGVSKVRVKLQDGDSVQISGMRKVTFTPVTAPFVTNHAKATLYAGQFAVGEDIGAGRYKVTPGAGQSGNFFVDGGNYVNEILGGSDGLGVPSVEVDLSEGDVITISGMDQVVFTPES
ncbi:hypothetical protein [Branchiibius cervicis]|uniref:Uncharacterized protein n=1 Tax=Branchiibius cervicis TaxID=908252 RepID=A0ABW2AWR4_9MICO